MFYQRIVFRSNKARSPFFLMASFRTFTQCVVILIGGVLIFLYNINFHLKHLDLHLKENLIRQTSFLQKKPSQKPASLRVKINAWLVITEVIVWSFFDKKHFYSKALVVIVGNILIYFTVRISLTIKTLFFSVIFK